MAALPLDMLTVILGHAPFSALNGLLRSCRAMSAVHVDPAKWVDKLDVFDGSAMTTRYALPNRVAHGESRARSICLMYEVVVMYDRGRATAGVAFRRSSCVATWALEAGSYTSWTVTRDGQTTPWLYGMPSPSFLVRWITMTIRTRFE